MGVIRTICGGWPDSRCRSRPRSRLNFWSVPPSSTSASQRHGVVALRQRIEQFVQRDGLFLLEALVKVLALQHLRDSEFRGQADHPLEAQLVQPLGVVADLGLFGVENLENLLLVGFGVRVDLFAGQRLAGDVAAGGVADERGEVADEEDDGVAEILKVLAACG